VTAFSNDVTSMWRLGERVCKDRLRPSIPDPQSEEYKKLSDSEKLYLDVMTQCWAHEPALRPSFTALYHLLEQISNKYVT
jgi:hypothetical protein